MNETDYLDADGEPAGKTGIGSVARNGAGPEVPGYLLREVVGRGGMGDVYRARDLELDREVAVKILQDRYPLDSPAAARFVAEARITAQLQHPGVPAVYRVAALADGRPFLAMKLIKGQTLDELLASNVPLNPLAVIEAVAQTLGYAHAHDVIHRDIKPANIMVGPFGEVQVMDWGLAKILSPARTAGEGAPADPEATAASTLISSTPAESGYTQYGSILGTPAYMPPEQAAGETNRVGPASDVFGVGALWCKLLTGHPPFAGANVESIRRNAMRGKTEEALARLDACGADPEVLALVKQCLAFEPNDRPADATEVANRIGQLRVAAEERAKQAELSRTRAEVQAAEQAKRRRVMQYSAFVVALVLLTGLGVSLRQMTRAISAEAKAKTNESAANQERDQKANALEAEKKARQHAFAALRSMTDEVVERKFAQGAVLTDEDKAFLRRVIAQFDAFAAIQGDDADSRAVRAEGRSRVGLMRHRLGELKSAEHDFDAAMEIQKQLAAEFPARPEFRQDLAINHINRGNLLSIIGRLKEAEAEYVAALRLYQQLAAEFPERPEFREKLAASHGSRGNLLGDTRRLKDAEADHDAAVTIYAQLAADWPTRPEFRQRLAASRNNRANLLQNTGRLDKAQADYDDALAVQKQLAADFPSRPEYRQELARSHNNRGNLLRGMGRLEEAEADYGAALALRKQLAADFPTQPEFRLDLARSYNSRGILLLAAHRQLEALNDYEAALALRKQLAADFPNRPDLRNELAGTCVNLAILHQQRGNAGEAKRLLEMGRPHHLAALSATPRSPNYRRFYRNHLSLLTEVQAELLEKDDALRTAETRRDLAWDAPADACDAAGFLSECIPIAAKHVKLDEMQRKEAALFYTDAALKLLREAIAKGYKDAARLKADPAFAPLRENATFQRLITELVAKSK